MKVTSMCSYQQWKKRHPKRKMAECDKMRARNGSGVLPRRIRVTQRSDRFPRGIGVSQVFIQLVRPNPQGSRAHAIPSPLTSRLLFSHRFPAHIFFFPAVSRGFLARSIRHGHRATVASSILGYTFVSLSARRSCTTQIKNSSISSSLVGPFVRSLLRWSISGSSRREILLFLFVCFE